MIQPSPRTKDLFQLTIILPLELKGKDLNVNTMKSNTVLSY